MNAVYKTNRSNKFFLTYFIFISVPPHFIVLPENLTVRNGSDAELRCQAEGSPFPVISWFKDGKSVSPGGRITFSNEGKFVFDPCK